MKEDSEEFQDLVRRDDSRGEDLWRTFTFDEDSTLRRRREEGQEGVRIASMNPRKSKRVNLDMMGRSVGSSRMPVPQALLGIDLLQILKFFMLRSAIVKETRAQLTRGRIVIGPGLK